MLILYITYIDFGPASSGSGVRPQRMYQAFLDEGHQVKLLSGRQGTWKTRGERAAAVAEIDRWLDSHRPDLCYIESPYYPILWGFDRRLIRRIHRMGVPIGYFYRDFPRRIPGMASRRKSFAGRMKDLFLDHMQRLTDKTLYNVDIVYFSTQKAAELFDYADMRALPPGGEDHLAEGAPQMYHCLYVGGLIEQYDGELLLRAFRLLNDGETRYPLTLVCREEEWNRIPAELKGGGWLDVRHVSGEALVPFLTSAGVGLIVSKGDHPYSKFGMPVKTFEYLSYGLPQVYIRSESLDQIIAGPGAGIGTDGTPEGFAQGIREMFSMQETYEKRRSAAASALRNNGLWIHRVRQVVRELTEEKK